MNPENSSPAGRMTDSTQDKVVADYWDDHSDETYINNGYWLANPLIADRFNRKAVGGREYGNWVDFCVGHFLGAQRPLGSILTIGCGDGALDRHLASLQAARRIDGVDIAPGRIETAKQLAAEAGYQNTIRYAVSNVEISPFPQSRYDAIFFNSSLHHIEGLEAILERSRKALIPNGLLFINEYVGPNRFDFSPAERDAMKNIFNLLPEKYRISNAAQDRGQIRHSLGLPDPEEVRRVDPSEAIRSQDIIPVVGQYFEVLEKNVMCGSMLQFMLDGIAANFRESDRASKEILEIIFQIEEALLAIGIISPHFVLMVCRPKRQAGQGLFQANRGQQL